MNNKNRLKISDEASDFHKSGENNVFQEQTVGSRKESKEDRFRRIAEARTNKIISMIRLLGNCSNPVVYTSRMEQVDKIFAAIESELDKAKERFHYPRFKNGKRFSLTKELELMTEEPQEPCLRVELSDGTFLRADLYKQDDFSRISICLELPSQEDPDLVCYAEYNMNHPCKGLRVVAYQSDKNFPVYYRSYVPKGDKEKCLE